MTTLFGLPAHALLVHAVVVLIPTAAVGIVLSAFVPRLRRFVLGASLALAVVAMGIAPLAEESGAALEDAVQETDALRRHEDLGETMPAVAIAMGVSGLAFGAVEVARSRGAGPSWARTTTLGTVVAGLAVATAVGGTVQVVLTGHSGAEATWGDVQVDGD